MNKKSAEDYKRSLVMHSIKFYIEFGNVNATIRMIHLIADMYVLMLLHKLPSPKIDSQLGNGLHMFMHSIKQLQPLTVEELKISEAMYSCLIRACLPDLKYRVSNRAVPKTFEAFRNWLSLAVQFNNTKEIQKFTFENDIDQCIATDPKSLNASALI